MADGLEFELKGMDELVGKLDAVVYETKYKSGRFALRKAAQLVAGKFRENARRINDPDTASSIEKNVVERWDGRTFKQTGDLAFRVGVMGGAGGNKLSSEFSGLPGLDTRHWRFVELGTSKARAQPIARPALENNIDAATNEFINQYDKSLDRAIKKAKKANRS